MALEFVDLERVGEYTSITYLCEDVQMEVVLRITNVELVNSIRNLGLEEAYRMWLKAANDVLVRGQRGEQIEYEVRHELGKDDEHN